MNPQAGPSGEERQLAHATANSLLNGDAISWDALIEHSVGPEFPNQFGKHDYIRSAAQLIETRFPDAARSAPLSGHTWMSNLTEEEGDLVVEVYGNLCRGGAIKWSELEHRQGVNYPNNLGRVQLLLLAIRREEEWFEWYD